MDIENRTCRRCGENKPISQYYYLKDTGTQRRVCITCHNTVKPEFSYVPIPVPSIKSNQSLMALSNLYKFNLLEIENIDAVILVLQSRREVVYSQLLIADDNATTMALRHQKGLCL